METRNLNQCWCCAGSEAKPQTKPHAHACGCWPNCASVSEPALVSVWMFVLVFRVGVPVGGCVRVFTNVQMSLRQTMECEQNFLPNDNKKKLFFLVEICMGTVG